MNNNLAGDVIGWLLRLLVHPLTGTISVVELVALLLCGMTLLGVILNGWDIWGEKGRAVKRNGARLTLSRGAWRRVIADGIKALCFTGIAAVAVVAPPSQNTQGLQRQALTILLLLTVICCLLFNQLNDFLTRKKAEHQLDVAYQKIYGATHIIHTVSRIE